jgi:hypothetical protein
MNKKRPEAIQVFFFEFKIGRFFTIKSWGLYYPFPFRLILHIINFNLFG